MCAEFYMWRPRQETNFLGKLGIFRNVAPKVAPAQVSLLGFWSRLHFWRPRAVGAPGETPRASKVFAIRDNLAPGGEALNLSHDLTTLTGWNMTPLGSPKLGKFRGHGARVFVSQKGTRDFCRVHRPPFAQAKPQHGG